MAYREIPDEERAKAIREYIETKELMKVSEKYSISAPTIKEGYKFILDQTDETLKKKYSKKNKIKVKDKGRRLIHLFQKKNKDITEEKSQKCPACGSEEIVKNGTFSATNFMIVFILSALPFLLNFYNKTTIIVQKHLCNKCGKSFVSEEQMMNKNIKNFKKIMISKLILILRFKLGLSFRDISEINKNVFETYTSMGYINKICSKAAVKSEEKIALLSKCKQNKSEVIFFDETFPKTKENGATNMGVVVDEKGLIRSLGIVNNKEKDIEAILKNALSTKFTPKYFISDYDNTYPKIITKLVPNIKVYKDFVHSTRQLMRDSKSAINKVKVSPNTLKFFTTQKEQNRIIKLKKKLLRKQLYKVMRRIIKGFKKQFVSVGTFYIEGGLNDLYELSERFPSLKSLYEKVNKFVKKHIDTWNEQMETYALKKIPLTSNIVESKNSIFKTFSKRAKSYGEKNLIPFFCGVALFQNFDVKTRGKNEGTSAIMRAGIDLKEFGADNFFDAVGLEEIVLGKKNLLDMKSNFPSEIIKKIAC